jgi:hypothetical protein
MNVASAVANDQNLPVSALDLTLIVSDPTVVSYLSQFDKEETQCEKALEAMKVGVIAIQSASPSLDTQVVQVKFAEVEGRIREQLTDFQAKVKNDLQRYFEEHNGVVPRSIDGIFGNNGSLTRTFQLFFDPTEGRLCRLMQAQIGSESSFGKALDPENKQGLVALIEARVQEQVEAKLDEVLQQFSLDHDGSAMSRLKAMLSTFFSELNESLGIKEATKAEARKGHVKGIEFQKDLYPVFSALGRQIGDETEFVCDTPGIDGRSKKGDYVSTLGETSGAPGLKVVVEVKDQPVKLKAAIDELQEAKSNREAVVGIFVFARGAEPTEVGDFRKIGEDFYVTADKDDLDAGRSLMFFDSAYRIVRALVVAAERKETAGEIDLDTIAEQIDALAAWSERISDMATKARTIQNSGKLIEQSANDLRQDLENRVAAIVTLLQRRQE